MSEVVGLQEAFARLRALTTSREALRQVGGALYREVEGVVARDVCANRIPVDQGTLRSSVITLSPEVGASQVSVTLAAGGPAAPYALAQHERLDYNHPSLERQRKGELTGQGEAKYMTNAFAAAERGQKQRIADDIARQWGTK